MTVTHVVVEPEGATVPTGETDTSGGEAPGDGGSTADVDPANRGTATEQATRPTVKPAIATKTTSTTAVTTVAKTSNPKTATATSSSLPKTADAIGLPCPHCCSCWEQRLSKLHAAADAPDFRKCGENQNQPSALPYSRKETAGRGVGALQCGQQVRIMPHTSGLGESWKPVLNSNSVSCTPLLFEYRYRPSDSVLNYR